MRPPPVPLELCDFDDAARVRDRLAAASGRAPRGRVLVGLRYGTRVRHICIREGEPSRNARSERLRLGCVTKVLTAALVRRVTATGSCGLDDDVAAWLGTPGSTRPLAGVSLRHLLEHTHGLDGSLIDALPMRAGGFIDSAALCEQAAAAPRLARPGRLYNYGDLGPWLAAAVLERCLRTPYRTLLRTRLLEPLGIEARCASMGRTASLPRRVCPAVGGPLALSLEGLLELLGRIGFAVHGAQCASRAGAATRVPGFSLLERGVLLGWKSYGQGWLGHNSTWPGLEALVRVQARSRIALVVASSDPPALAIAARLFASMLPELGHLRVPRPLGEREARDFDRERCLGTYRTAAERITIAGSSSGELRLHARLGARTRTGPAARRSIEAQLRPAQSGVLLTVPSAPQLPFVQLLEPPGEGRAYLWNGHRIWAKVDV